MKQRIKVAFLDSSNIFSGAEYSLLSLLEYINNDIYEPILVFEYPKQHQKRYNSLKCKILFLNDNAKWWMGSDYWKNPIKGSDFIKRILLGFKLAYMLKKNNVSLLHINLMKPNATWWVLWSRLFGIKVIAHVRSDFPDWMPSVALQKKCNAIICVSRYVQDMVSKDYTHPNIYTVYDAVDFSVKGKSVTIEQAKSILGISKSARVLSSVGLLSPHKGHDMAILAFYELRKIYNDLFLVIAGGGSKSELFRLKKMIVDRGLEESTFFTEGQISNIEDVYVASELIYSLTNRGEAFGRVPFEANKYLTPALAPAKGAALELINDGITGFLVDPVDIVKIVERSKFILDNSSISSKVVIQGRDEFSKKFHPAYSASQIENVYFLLLK